MTSLPEAELTLLLLRVRGARGPGAGEAVQGEGRRRAWVHRGSWGSPGLPGFSAAFGITLPHAPDVLSPAHCTRAILQSGTSTLTSVPLPVFPLCGFLSLSLLCEDITRN